MYYEGKEWETNVKEKRPGELSDELKDALNIPPGAPPPWLLNMQRYGPPPSFPTLRIAGLNAPLPSGYALDIFQIGRANRVVRNGDFILVAGENHQLTNSIGLFTVAMFLESCSQLLRRKLYVFLKDISS